MKNKFERPSINIRSFSKELLCKDSNVTQAMNALTQGTYSINREKVSVAALEKK